FLRGWQRARKQLDITNQLDAGVDGFANRRMLLGDAGADRDQVRAIERRCRKRTRLDGDRRKRARELGGVGRRIARVGDAHIRAVACEMADERKPGLAEPEHDSVAIAVAHHLSFSVERPNSTSSIVMIQKRTTTWFSFQPFSS